MSYDECTDAAKKQNTLFRCICSKDEDKLFVNCIFKMSE